MRLGIPATDESPLGLDSRGILRGIAIKGIRETCPGVSQDDAGYSSGGLFIRGFSSHRGDSAKPVCSALLVNPPGFHHCRIGGHFARY